jgi:taurine dioxygenase
VLDVIAMTPIGARLSGFRVDALDERTVMDLRHLLAEHGVLVLPGQQVDNDEFLRFLRSFGPTMFTVGETPVSGFPELNVISNVGRAEPP